MKKKIKRLALIPARLGSKRIKKKNIKLFCGNPMISFPITELKKSKIFDKVFVSTEDNLVKKISEKFGASVDFLRNKKLAKDNTPLNLVIENVVHEFEKRGQVFEEIWMVYACNPLLKAKDIISANKAFQKTKKLYPMMSMKEFEVPIEWAFEKKKDFFKSIDHKNLFKDSKKIKKKYYECASFIIYHKKHLANHKNYFNFYGYLMNNAHAIDIDNLNDWQHALKLYKIQNTKYKIKN